MSFVRNVNIGKYENGLLRTGQSAPVDMQFVLVLLKEIRLLYFTREKWEWLHQEYSLYYILSLKQFFWKFLLFFSKALNSRPFRNTGHEKKALPCPQVRTWTFSIHFILLWRFMSPVKYHSISSFLFLEKNLSSEKNIRVSSVACKYITS